jgi:hypothetical protein
MNNELANGVTVSQTLKDGWRISILHFHGQHTHYLVFNLQCDPNVGAQFNDSVAVQWSINRRTLSTGVLTEGYMRGSVT